MNEPNGLVVYKYEVPIDSHWHPIPGFVKVVLVDSHPDRERSVDVWAEIETVNGKPCEYAPRAVQVFGTGDQIPANAQHVGSLVHRAKGVWHVYLS